MQAADDKLIINVLGPNSWLVAINTYTRVVRIIGVPTHSSSNVVANAMPHFFQWPLYVPSMFQ